MLRELRDKLGDAATDSLVDLLHQFRGEQREDMIAVVEERFARHVAETRDTLRGEMHAGFLDVQKQFLQQQQQIGNVRADLSKGIGDVRKEVTVQTRWLLTVLLAATILIPVTQRVLAALFPRDRQRRHFQSSGAPRASRPPVASSTHRASAG